MKNHAKFLFIKGCFSWNGKISIRPKLEYVLKTSGHMCTALIFKTQVPPSPGPKPLFLAQRTARSFSIFIKMKLEYPQAPTLNISSMYVRNDNHTVQILHLV